MLPSLILGIFVIVTGIGFLLSHVIYYKKSKEKENDDSEKKDSSHLQRRFRRRIKGSSILIIIGFFIPLIDYLIIFGPQKTNAVIALLLLLLLLVILVIISIGDIISTQHYRRTVQARLKEIELKKATLQTEADIMRFRKGDPEVQNANHQNGKTDKGDENPPRSQEKLF